MAISANTVFEIRTAGSDTNGGGFTTGAAGTDYSQQNSKNTVGSDISVTNAVGAGSTTLTSATANFSTAIVGNIIYLQGGTGSLAAGWYQVTARASTTSITLDRAVATGTGITMNIGGALASIGASAVAGAGAGMIVFIQSGTYSITSATINVAGGTISNSSLMNWVGYNTNRTMTNTDTKPLIQYGVSGVSMFVSRGTVYNLAFDGNGQTTARVNGSSDSTNMVNCSFTNMNTGSGSTTGTFNNCSATANSALVFAGVCVDCEAYSNTATPFGGGVQTITIRCLSYNNTGATTDGFNLSAVGSMAANCSAYGNGRAGFQWNSPTRASTAVNCHAENNTGWGFDDLSGSGVGSAQVLVNCSAYNNTAGTISNLSKATIIGFITVTAGSVFVNAASANFALNNTTNQGALLRAAGVPAFFPAGLTASYQDIGASQHQDTGGGGNATVAYTSS